VRITCARHVVRTPLRAQAAELDAALDAPLRVLYLKQLRLLRDRALARYKATARDSEASDFEALLATDEFFGWGVAIRD